MFDTRDFPNKRDRAKSLSWLARAKVCNAKEVLIDSLFSVTAAQPFQLGVRYYCTLGY